MTAVVDQSPVRALGKRLETGCVLLADVQSTYLDGAEAGLVAKFGQARDLSSTSDELAELAEGWAETYHLSTERANVLRCFDLPRGARVLEIGAGCGAITRYLGEAGCVVDAVEPVPARATVARARTRDLSDVEVFIGGIEHVPAEPVYDVVIVVGVLEYVGNGTSDLSPYAAFLDAINARLRPGGLLLLAIENKLGVKYLAGSPEDHSGRIFDSVEGYPGKTPPARTFSRRELQQLLADAGMTSRSFVAFPDYKMARTVMSTDLPTPVESLLYRIPTFPSPDRGRPRPKLLDERSAWKSAVRAGLAGDLGNSLVLTAYKPGEEQDVVWPADRIATYFSEGRPARLTMRTDVVRDGDSALFHRKPLVARVKDTADRDRAIITDLAPARYVPGVDALEAIVEHNPAGIAALLAEWVELVRDTHRTDGRVEMDLVPHNLVVTEDGTLARIDAEWQPVEVDPQTVIERGVFWLAHRVSEIVAPSRWGGMTTVAELAAYLGDLAGLDSEGEWLEHFYAAEAAWQAEVHEPVRLRNATAQQRREFREQYAAGTEKNLRAQGALQLQARTLGVRSYDVLEHAVQERNKALAALQERDAAMAGLEGIGVQDIGQLMTAATQRINELATQLRQAEQERDAALARLSADPVA